jgi:hypothetical protein
MASLLKLGIEVVESTLHMTGPELGDFLPRRRLVALVTQLGTSWGRPLLRGHEAERVGYTNAAGGTIRRGKDPTPVRRSERALAPKLRPVPSTCLQPKHVERKAPLIEQQVTRALRR